MKLCACGCGLEVRRPGNTYLHGHCPRSPETRRKIVNNRILTDSGRGRLRESKLGDKNPSKRPEVVKKISDSKRTWNDEVRNKIVNEFTQGVKISKIALQYGYSSQAIINILQLSLGINNYLRIEKDRLRKFHTFTTRGKWGSFDSFSEKKIGDFLSSKNIKFILHPKMVFPNGRKYCPDFHIPERGLYIEYFGSMWRRGGNHTNKLNCYLESNLNFVGIYPSDFGDLDSIFLDMSKHLSICEIFHSICGEGQEQGLPATFIRGYGCNRKCLYCDTKYSWNGKYEVLSIRNILDRVMKTAAQRLCRTIFLTGGEITIQKELSNLISCLRRHKFLVILQTNGTQFLPEVFDKVDGLLSVDIKGPSSGKLADLDIINDIYRRYKDKKFEVGNLQFKFVVSNEEDYNYARGVIPRFPNTTFILQPECSKINIKEIDGDIVIFPSFIRWLQNAALNDKLLRGYDIRVLAQLHKFLGIK